MKNSTGIVWVRISSLALFLCAAALSAQSAFVGTIKTTEGQPLVVRNGQEIPAVPGMQLEEHDLLKSNQNSRVGFILRDGSRVAMGPETELRIQEFAFDPSRGNLRSMLQLLRGAAAFVSGKIAKLAPGSAEVETPVAMIGLRGTTFAVHLEPN